MSRYRGRRSYKRYRSGRRRSGAFRNVVFALLAVAMIFVGYSASGPIIEFIRNPDSFKRDNSSDDTSQVESIPSEEPVESTPVETNKGDIRAVFMPAGKLAGGQLDEFISAAKNSGINAFVINMKDKDGEVFYSSKVQGATISQDTKLDVGAITAKLKQENITPIAEMYCFIDRLMPYVNKDAAILLTGGSGYRWLDDSPEKGGKPWLNPYSDLATDYLCSLASELADLGFDMIMLNGVQFPPKRMTSRADYGEKANDMSKDDALVSFIESAKKAVSDKGAKVVLAMSSTASLGIDTTDYGGNPLDFGAEYGAPSLMPADIPKKLNNGQIVIDDPMDDLAAAIKMAAGQLSARVELSEKKSKLVPWLQAYDVSESDVKVQWQALEQAGVKSYIFYNPNGEYVFDSLKN